MKLAFETERLWVYRDYYSPHSRQFLAYLKDDDRPMLAANAIVSRDDECSGWVDWLEVASEHRRKGLGTELLRGLESYYKGELTVDAATADGEAFLRSLGITEPNS